MSGAVRQRRATSDGFGAASRRLLETVVRNAPLLLVFFDRDGVVRLSTGRALAAIGVQPGEGVGASIFDGEGAERARRALAGETVAAVGQYRGRWIEGRWEPLRDEEGAIVGAVVVGVDITERYQAEREAARAQQQIESLIDSLDAVVWEADAATGAMTFVSRQAERLLGYPQARWLEDPGFWLARVHPDDRDRLVERRRRAARRREPFEAEYRMVAADGREVWVHSRARVVAETGQPVRVRGVLADVTERKRLEERARQSERLAAAGTMAGAVAHEVRNPLNAASLQLELLATRLAKPAPEPAALAPIVADVQAELDRLAARLDGFLDFVRARPVLPRPGDLRLLLDEAARRVAPEAAAAGVMLAVEIGPLPRVSFDADRMRQVLDNLLRNALQATPSGGAITLRARGVPGGIEVDVEDTGKGIPPGSPVFDAFYTTRAGGTGLGLAIVQRLVSEHDGRVHHASRAGRTCFTVWLPTPATSAIVSPTAGAARDDPGTGAAGTGSSGG